MGQTSWQTGCQMGCQTVLNIRTALENRLQVEALQRTHLRVQAKRASLTRRLPKLPNPSPSLSPSQTVRPNPTHSNAKLPTNPLGQPQLQHPQRSTPNGAAQLAPPAEVQAAPRHRSATNYCYDNCARNPPSSNNSTRNTALYMTVWPHMRILRGRR